MFRIYTGPAIETGTTCIQGKVTPGVKYLFNRGLIQSPVVDWGSGKYARNAKWLREQGLQVYAYDPWHGNGDGYQGISSIEPKERFKTGFSSYVLNVIRLQDEQYILEMLKEITEYSYHVVRGDILGQVKKWMEKGNPTTVEWFRSEFATPEEIDLYDQGRLPSEVMLEFARFGVKTGMGYNRFGFQRSCNLSISLIHRSSGYRIYHGE